MDSWSQARARIPVAVVALAGALGVLGDTLLRIEHAPGLGPALWLVALVAGTLALGSAGVFRLSMEARVLLGAAALFAAGLAWRESPALKLLSVAAIGTLFALPAYRAGTAWVRRAGLVDGVAACIDAALAALFGSVLLLRDVDRTRAGSVARSARAQQGRAVLRGVLIALPLLLLFGALFAAADAVFAQLVQEVIRFDLANLVGHAVLAFVLAWGYGGYLHRYVASGPARQRAEAAAGLRIPIGALEGAVVLGLLNVLFAVFVTVQIRYLFGGASMVEVTPGLTYAEYARRGFFELVAVAALMLPVLLALDWAVVRRARRDEGWFRALALAQLALLFVVMGSAIARMRLYQSAFGLTEQRFYAVAFMMWLGAVFLWFAATVLRGRRDRFFAGPLVAGLATVALLVVLNPSARIVRSNAERLAGGAEFDARYAASLGADAVPALLHVLPSLPHADQCVIADRLLEWEKRLAAHPDWRSWSVAQHVAANRIAAAHERLPAGCPAETQKGSSPRSPPSPPSPGSGVGAVDARRPLPPTAPSPSPPRSP